MAQGIQGSMYNMDKLVSLLQSAKNNENIDIEINGLDKIRELKQELEDLSKQKNQIIVDVKANTKGSIDERIANLRKTINGLIIDLNKAIEKTGSDSYIDARNIIKNVQTRLNIEKQIKEIEEDIQRIHDGGLKRKVRETDDEYLTRQKEEIDKRQIRIGSLEGQLADLQNDINNIDIHKALKYIQETQEYSSKELDTIKEIIKAVGELNTLCKETGSSIPKDLQEFINTFSAPEQLSPEILVKGGKDNALQLISGLQYQEEEAVEKSTKNIDKNIKQIRQQISSLIDDEIKQLQEALSDNNINQEGLDQIRQSFDELQDIISEFGTSKQNKTKIDIIDLLDEIQEKIDKGIQSKQKSAQESSKEADNVVKAEKKKQQAIEETDKKSKKKSVDSNMKARSEYTGQTEEELQKCLQQEERWIKQCKEGSEAYNKRKSNIEEIEKLLNKISSKQSKTDKDENAKDKSIKKSKEKAKAAKEEADAVNDAADAQDRYIRRNSINGKSDSYVAAINKITDLHVDENGNEKRVINGDKLLKEILDLDEKIYNKEQEIKNARNEDAKGPLQDTLNLYKDQLSVMERLESDAINDPSTRFTQFQAQVIEEQRAIKARVRANEEEKNQLDLINNALAQNVKEEQRITKEKEKATEQAIKEAEANIKAKQDANILENKRDTREYQLNDYYDELNRLGLLTQDVEGEFIHLRELLATADTNGLKEYDTALTKLQVVMKDSVKDAKELNNIQNNNNTTQNNQVNKSQTNALNKQISLYREWYEVKKKLSKINDTDEGSVIKRNALEENRANIEKEILAAYREEVSLGGGAINNARRLAEFAQIREKAEREINEATANSQASIIQSLSVQRKNVQNLFDHGKFTEGYKKELDRLIQNIDNLSQLAPKLDLSELQKQFSDLKNQIDDTIGQKGLASNKQAAQSTLAKLGHSIDDIIAKNSAMGNDFKKRFENLRIKIDASQSNSEVEELKAEIVKLESELIRAGKTGKSFFAIFKDRLIGANAQLLARYFSWQDWIRYGREALNTIRDLDTQLVDLRKTTTMNNTELEQFYFESNNIAKKLGTTTSQIIAQASAWSRLGYSTKEASESMAALSSKFAAISPGMSLDDATDGLVSTMKAFHVEVEDTERDIMDNVNRIGKQQLPKHMVTYGAAKAA